MELNPSSLLTMFLKLDPKSKKDLKTWSEKYLESSERFSLSIFRWMMTLQKGNVFLYWLWTSCGIEQPITFSSSGFFLLLSSSLFFSRLFSAIADWMSTIVPHMVLWLLSLCKFRMQVSNVLHAAHWRYRTQKIAKNLPFVHHYTIFVRLYLRN